MNISYPTPPLQSEAKIIFISACDVDTNMQNWLGITDGTKSRALVVPQNATDVDLDMGEFEWLQILRYLTSGKNLKEAVSKANDDVKAGTWLDIKRQPVPPQSWKVIGDNGNGGSGIHF